MPRLASVGTVFLGVRSWLGSLRPDRRTLGTDAVAGVPGAIGSVPDGMAAAVLVGVNPVYGLYASIAGPIAGGLTASTQRMVITTTTAAALAAGSAVSGFSGADRADALFLLTIMAGALMVAAGLLRLGRYTRFVSVSVLTGFLTGVAFNIIFGQLGDLLGAPAEGSVSLEKAWNVVTHPGAISWASAAVGLSALVLMIGLSRTRLATFASVIALIVPTLISLGLSGIARVEDVGDIPTGIPMPHLPPFSLFTSLNLLVGAAAIMIIVLVQGTGVAESAPNPDGSLTNPDRDFLAQGIGNIAAGLFRGQPVGGSVGQSALNIAAGARSRWAAIFSGIWMLLIVVVFSGLVGKIAIPTLAAVLIFAAASSLRTGRIDTIARTGIASRIAFVTTLLATLVLPVAAAVGIGVSLSLLLQLGQEADDLTVMRAQLGDDDRFVEEPAPAKLRERRGDAPPPLRQPPVRRRAHAAGAPARPGRRDAPRRDPAPARAHPARRDLVHRARRLRRTDPRGRRAPLPQRRRPRPRTAAHPHAPRRPAGRRHGPAGVGDGRRLDPRGLCAGTGVAHG